MVLERLTGDANLVARPGALLHKRRTCCNIFRYGQCNTEIPGVTQVVCRVIKCVNPCKLNVNCNCTTMIENAVCAQEEGCL